jgi:predicted small integral membrane protein
MLGRNYSARARWRTRARWRRCASILSGWSAIGKLSSGLRVNQNLSALQESRGKSPRRYNSLVRQPMRHVMALRISKAVLVFAIALFYTILVLNNITDYGSNYEFVRHVLMMDSTFPGNHGMWRAVNSSLVHTVFYIGIIAWESVTMLLCWWAGVRLLKSYRADTAQFATALNFAVIALTTSLLMWLVAFLDVGGEWFLMWQSQIWNGQQEAFRMFTIVGVVFLVVVQRDPTPD